MKTKISTTLTAALILASFLLLTHNLLTINSRFDIETRSNLTKVHPATKETSEKKNLSEYETLVENFKTSFSRDPPVSFDRWFKFAKDQKCELGDLSIYGQIYKDMAPWLSKSEFEVSDFEFMSKQSKLYRVNFVNGSPQTNSGAMHELYKTGLAEQVLSDFNFTIFRNRVDEPYSLPSDHEWSKDPAIGTAESMEYNACMKETFKNSRALYSHGNFLGPSTWEVTNRQVPVFSDSKVSCYADIVAPFDYHAGRLLSKEIKNNDFYNHFNNFQLDPYSWEEKVNILFFRGSSTGTSFKSPSWRRSNRIRLAQWEKYYGSLYPDRIFTFHEPSDIEKWHNKSIGVDVGISRIIQCSSEECERVRKVVTVKPEVKQTDILRFKYHLVLDGNSWPSRLQSLMASNSVVLYNGIYTDWYNHLLVPFVHYVPVQPDLGDLEEKLDWLWKNDDKAREIARNAKKFVEKYAQNLSQLKCYSGLLMLEYASRFPRDFK